MKVLTLDKKNILTILLLAGIVFSVIQIGRSASPDPGHPWADIGDTASDALSVARGGTGQTSLTADSLVSGNGANPVTLIAPGTAGNVLTSNGTVWSSSALSGLVLLYTDETDTAEVNNTTTETVLKNWNLSVAPTDYRYFILEAEVMANQNKNGNALVTYTWNFNGNITLLKSLVWRTYGIAYSNINMGLKYAATIKTIVNAANVGANTNFILKGQMNNANLGSQMQAQSFRVYGVK